MSQELNQSEHYIVTARKWRPMTFAQIVGQDHISTTLKNAILSGRVHHAYLFTGPRGVGKTTSARIIAYSSKVKLYQPTKNRTFQAFSLNVSIKALMINKHICKTNK